MARTEPNGSKGRWTGLLDLLQTVAIVVGIVFGVVELAQFREEQSRQMELELARSLTTPEVFAALEVVLTLPEDADEATRDSIIGTRRSDILFLAQTFETIGILVYERDLSLSTVDEFFGSTTLVVWDRLSPWLSRERRRLEQAHLAEWFEWLADRLREYRNRTRIPPAYEAYEEWEPEDLSGS